MLSVCTLYTYYEAFVFIKKSKMLKTGQNCKHVQKTLGEKAEALNNIEKGLSNKEVAAKYNVPKISYVHWSKIKKKSCHN